jgi:hypothetical protein
MLDRAQLRLLALGKGKQMVSHRLLSYDTTNFYTFVASTNRRSHVRDSTAGGRYTLISKSKTLPARVKRYWRAKGNIAHDHRRSTVFSTAPPKNSLCFSGESIRLSGAQSRFC